MISTPLNGVMKTWRFSELYNFLVSLSALITPLEIIAIIITFIVAVITTFSQTKNSDGKGLNTKGSVALGFMLFAALIAGFSQLIKSADAEKKSIEIASFQKEVIKNSETLLEFQQAVLLESSSILEAQEKSRKKLESLLNPIGNMSFWVHYTIPFSNPDFEEFVSSTKENLIEIAESGNAWVSYKTQEGKELIHSNSVSSDLSANEVYSGYRVSKVKFTLENDFLDFRIANKFSFPKAITSYGLEFKAYDGFDVSEYSREDEIWYEASALDLLFFMKDENFNLHGSLSGVKRFEINYETQEIYFLVESKMEVDFHRSSIITGTDKLIEYGGMLRVIGLNFIDIRVDSVNLKSGVNYSTESSAQQPLTTFGSSPFYSSNTIPVTFE